MCLGEAISSHLLFAFNNMIPQKDSSTLIIVRLDSEISVILLMLCPKKHFSSRKLPSRKNRLRQHTN